LRLSGFSLKMQTFDDALRQVRAWQRLPTPAFQCPERRRFPIYFPFQSGFSNVNDPDILTFDMNALGYAAMYQPNLARLTHKGMSTAALHGAMASLLERMALYPEAMPVVLWDGRPTWRSELLPGYKANRSDAPEKVEIRAKYRQQVPYIQQMLMQLGIPQIRPGYAEADDVGGVFTAVEDHGNPC
jgi:5'-3' exonuclease